MKKLLLHHCSSFQLQIDDVLSARFRRPAGLQGHVDAICRSYAENMSGESDTDGTGQVEHLVRMRLRMTVEQARLRNGPLFVGLCLSCGLRLPSPERWCGPGCRNRWLRRR